MDNNQRFEKIISEMPDKRLAMFVICCHVDKQLEEKLWESKYNILIQAGAALTDRRICEVNDFEDFEDSISERNQRYSEMTAMYWAGKHISTEYVGISHYRRRFLLSDEELDKLMSEGFDIITTQKYILPESINENYNTAYYGYDWKLFLKLLHEHSPEYDEVAQDIFSKDVIHPCNMNIFRSDIYKEFCDWAFPILDIMYKETAWKTDTYQRRDVGFIGERMSSLFVEKKIRDGAKVIEATNRDLRSKGWTAEDECDLTDFDKVYQACEKYYKENNITRLRNMVAGALKNGAMLEPRFSTVALLCRTALKEQKSMEKTLYEYLPNEWRGDLATLTAAYTGISTMLKILSVNMSSEAIGLFNEFIESTGFSEIAIKDQCKNNKINPAIYERVTGKKPYLIIVPTDICYGSLKKIAHDIGNALEEKGESVYYLDVDMMGGEECRETLELLGEKIKAVIGVQAQAINNDYFQQMKEVPKIQVVMDCTYFVPELFVKPNDKNIILCQDGDYAAYVREKYGYRHAYHFWLGAGKDKYYWKDDREKDLIFVGSYTKPKSEFGDWSDECRGLYEYMKSNPEMNMEKALVSAGFVDEGDINEVREKIWNLRQACFKVTDYYRHKVYEAILRAGIKIDVYGDTWNSYDGEGKENLVIHTEIDSSEAISEMKKAKLSLNVMSWHKNGITERVINSMSSGAVCISEETMVLHELFCSEDCNEQEIVLFNLREIDRVPEMIRLLLKDSEKCKKISDNAYKRINDDLDWACRIEELIKLI